MEAGGIRQRMTLSDQLSLLQPVNLRDLLKVRDGDDAAAVPGRNTTVTLAAVLATDKNSTSSSAAATATGGGGGVRTLLDVISEEEESRGSAGSTSWRNLTERLRIRHAAAATWMAGSPSSSNPAADGGGSGRMTTIRVSLMTLMEMREQDEDGEEEENYDEDEGEEEEEGRTGAARVTADDVSVADDDDVAGVGSRHVCCVCMVRKKGAAFIPCGHTFCRFCSRELFLGRGNCPLCNTGISEVLDIF